MGGRIQVESKIGIGSRFWFTVDFPVLTLPVASSSLKESRRLIGYEGERCRVLIVDDTLHNRAVLHDFLEPLGFETYMAENGEQAVAQAGNIVPHHILMDLVMPIMDGFEATRQLRKMPRLANTVIIAISASVLSIHRDDSRLVGCHDFVPKPVDFEKLSAVLVDHLQLNWVYADDIEKPEELAAVPAHDLTVMTPPVADVVEQLYQLAIIGDLTVV